jgi:hypothetical protein
LPFLLIVSAVYADYAIADANRVGKNFPKTCPRGGFFPNEEPFTVRLQVIGENPFLPV